MMRGTHERTAEQFMMAMRRDADHVRRRTTAVFLLAVAGAACGALYPELKTPLRPFDGTPPAAEIPKNVRFIAFKGAKVPHETRDGRKWDSVGNEAPDPYAVLYVNKKLLLKTPVESNTLTPSWPTGPRGNFRVSKTDRLRIELWEANALNDHPIGLIDIGEVSADQRDSGEINVETDTGAEVTLTYEPPHAQLGLGFACEARDSEVGVTRIYEESPAARAGLKVGDLILSLDGRSVKDVKTPELKTIINQQHVDGIAFHVKHKDGVEADLKIKEGPVYVLASEEAGDTN